MQKLAIWKLTSKTKELVLAVNISALQFKEQDFVDYVKLQIHKYQIDPSKLKLELTESIAIENLQLVKAKMLKLREIGISLAIDDFGTGFSSLSYLKQLPFDEIKIDKQFISNVISDHNDAIMVKTIIGLAKNFKMGVIAEGVETDQQVAFLKQYDCDSYQGYFFSRPIPIVQFEKIIELNYISNLIK